MSVSGLNCVESCLNCHLRSRNFFCNLSQDSIEAFNKIKHAAVFPEHAVVLVEGQRPCGIFILCHGTRQALDHVARRQTLIIRIAEPGEILGLHAVVTGGRYELTVETMQPCQLDYVGRDDILRFLTSTLTPLYTLLSIWLETVRMRMVSRARSGCHTRSQRGLPDSCLKPPPMARSAMERCASGWQ